MLNSSACRYSCALIALSLTLLGPVHPVLAAADSRVTVGSPSTRFPENAQNEPAVAVNPRHPQVLAAGANDVIDNEPCTALDDNNACPITSGVSVNGIYFSFDGGATWTQPTYSGWSARTGTAQFGPIGTVPWYYESGLETGGDPALAFGPVPGPDGTFSWDNGSRLYYATLAGNPGVATSEKRIKGGPVKGVTAIVVSRTDDPQTAALGGEVGKAAWMLPVFVSTRQSSVTLSDKEAIWADNAESSPHFGTVYACWASFGHGNAPLLISRSIDGAETWSPPNQITSSAATDRQGCTIRTDSQGTLYAFFRDSDSKQFLLMMARSFDGGVTFEHPQAVASHVPVGARDPRGFRTFDGVAGTRTPVFPSVDIANGTPSGLGATDEIVLIWPDARHGLNNEEALVQYSVDHGDSWSTPVNAAEPGDRPDFPAIAISPSGQDVYITYDAFLDPWRITTSDPRRVQGVVRHANVGIDGSLVGLSTLHRAAVGDARASSHGFFPEDEGIFDYNYAVATDDYGVALWMDVRNAALCPVMNRWRQSLVTNPANPRPAPSPAADCPRKFGNADVYSASFADPTP